MRLYTQCELKQIIATQKEINAITHKIIKTQLELGNMPGFCIAENWLDKIYIWLVDMMPKRMWLYAHTRWEQKKFAEKHEVKND